MAYRSKIKLEIGEVPKTKDAAQLPDNIDIYNSIHILAQYVNGLMAQLDPEINPDTPPYVVQPFKTFFYGRIHQTVATGQLLSCYGVQGDWPAGWYLGTPSWPIDASSISAGSKGNGFVAVAMEDGEAGDEIKIGIGPAILRVAGVSLGQVLFGRTAFSPAPLGGDPTPNGDGNVYIFNLNGVPENYNPNLEYLVIGACIGFESVYVYDHVDYWTTQASNPPAAPPPDTGGGE